MYIWLGQMAIDSLTGAKFTQVKAEPFLNGSVKIHSVKDLDLVVA